MKNIYSGISRLLTLLSFLLLYLGNTACAQTTDYYSPFVFDGALNSETEEGTAKLSPLPVNHPALLLKEMMPCESEELQEEEEDENKHNHPNIHSSGISVASSQDAHAFCAGFTSAFLPKRKRYLVFRCLRINC